MRMSILIFIYTVHFDYLKVYTKFENTSSNTHRTTGCLDDRLLTMMTDMGFYVPGRVGYNFGFAKLLE